MEANISIPNSINYANLINSNNDIANATADTQTSNAFINILNSVLENEALMSSQQILSNTNGDNSSDLDTVDNNYMNNNVLTSLMSLMTQGGNVQNNDYLSLLNNINSNNDSSTGDTLGSTLAGLQGLNVLSAISNYSNTSNNNLLQTIASELQNATSTTATESTVQGQMNEASTSSVKNFADLELPDEVMKDIEEALARKQVILQRVEQIVGPIKRRTVFDELLYPNANTVQAQQDDIQAEGISNNSVVNNKYSQYNNVLVNNLDESVNLQDNNAIAKNVVIQDGTATVIHDAVSYVVENTANTNKTAKDMNTSKEMYNIAGTDGAVEDIKFNNDINASYKSSLANKNSTSNDEFENQSSPSKDNLRYDNLSTNLLNVNGSNLSGTDHIVRISDDSSKLSHSIMTQIKDQIVLAKNEGKQTVTMQLNPESLGKLNIKMIFDKGNLSVEIITSNTKTQSLLLSNVSDLKLVLQNSLADKPYVDVTLQHNNQDQNFFDENQGSNAKQQYQDNKNYANEQQNKNDNDNDNNDFMSELSRLRNYSYNII